MTDLPPPEQGTNPLAVASVVLAFVGVITYCCGSLMCLGWIAPVFWVIGAILGGVAWSQGGPSKTLAMVGVVTNVLFGLLFLGLIMLYVGIGLLSAVTDQANH
jgi:hypothetical protein